MLRRVTGVLLLLCFIGVPAVCAQSVDDTTGAEDLPGPPGQIAGELELEKDVAERIEKMLQPLVGPVVVITDLSLSLTPVKLEGLRHSRDSSLPALPVSVNERVKQIESAGWDFNRITGISIRIFVSEKMSEEDVSRITDLVPRWINLNYARGDQIIVERVPFVKPPMTLVDFILSSTGLLFSGIVLAGLGVILALVGWLYGGRGRGSAAVEGATAGAAAGGGVSGPISAESLRQAFSGAGTAGTAGTGAAAGGSGDGTLSLAQDTISVRLVREEDGRKALGTLARIDGMDDEALGRLLRTQSAEAGALALMIAKPRVAAAYLNGLDATARRGILEAWNGVSSMGSGRFKAIADELRAGLDKVSSAASALPSGVQRLADVLNTARESEARSIYTDLRESDPAFAGMVRERVFFLEDLLELSSRDLKRAVAGVPRTNLAHLLKESPEKVRTTILDHLSDRAAGMLREEMATIARANEEQAATAKEAVRRNLERMRSTSGEPT
ncbi:hypothetical protein GF324_07590 [bacterium]|nr:hypothetical protein [bacterium]